MELNASFWNNRYLSNDIGWDIGYISPPLQQYFDQLADKNLKILIPGGGNSYEAEYLFTKGFTNVYVVDLSATALENIKQRIPDFPDSQLIHGNYFDLDTSFDLIIEQTFFCAISPSLRQDYVTQTHRLLTPKGKLVGLLFNVPLNDDQPPFGGSKEEYNSLFSPHFDIQLMEPSYNSIEERAGTELFIKMAKS